MAAAKSKLEFIIGLIDQVTGPSQKVMGTVQDMEKNINKGFSSMRTGALGLIGAGVGIYHTLKPAIDMSRTMGSLKSLDVIPAELQKLEKAGDRFAMKFGEDSIDFVKSAYNMQSSIQGLVDGELASFTRASNVLGKATEADAATATKYITTMYGIFEKTAINMGKGKWIEQVTGMTATAVKMFRTTGQDMNEAFKGIGSTGEKLGITMSEQIGILGTLQATMPGSEAGTKYRAFLGNVIEAQNKLGLQFVDSQGKMLPVVQILDKIKGKFGDLDAMEMAQLKKAFGSEEALAVVTNLMDKTGALKKNIDKLGKVKGMEAAEKMALDHTDAFAKMASTIQVLTKNVMFFGMKAINPLIEKLQTNMVWLNSLIDKYPFLGRVIGYVVTTILGLTAAFAVFKLASGAVYLLGGAMNFLNLATSLSTYKFIAKTAAIKAYNLWLKLTTIATKINHAWIWLQCKAIDAWTLTQKGLNKVLVFSGKLLNAGKLIAYKGAMLAISAATKVWAGLQWLQCKAIDAWTLTQKGLNKVLVFSGKLLNAGKLIAYKGAMLAISAATKVWAGLQWLLNAAFWANPITWVIAGVAGLVAGIAALFYWYEDIEKALQNSMWGIVLLGIIDAVLAPFRILWDLAKAFFALITGNWSEFSWGKTITGTIEEIGNSFGWLMNIGKMLKDKLFNIFGGITGKLSKLTGKLKSWFGFGDDKTEKAIKVSTPVKAPVPVGIPSMGMYNTRSQGIRELDNQRKLNIPAGGVSNTTNNNNTTNYGGVTINSQQPMSPAMLEEWQAMQGAY